MYYEVDVKEILSRKIIIEADTREEAQVKAENRWHLGQEPMTEKDFSHAEFVAGKERTSFSYEELTDNCIGGILSVAFARNSVADVLKKTKKEEVPYLPYWLSNEEKIDGYIRQEGLLFDDLGNIVGKAAA